MAGIPAAISGILAAFLLCTASAPTAAAQGGTCGGAGQRACCLLENTSLITGSNPLGDCAAGLTQIPGCGGSCQCGGTGPASSSGTCVLLTPCGGRGQRSCLAIENVNACQGGLTIVPGCTGDCQGPSGEISPGMCTVYPQTIAEPATGRTAAQTPGCPVNGYADNHIHMFAHLGQGGGVLAGQPYDAVNGINGALTEDFGTNMAVEEWDETQLPSPVCPSYMGSSCGALIFHQGHDALEGDVVGNATNDQAGPASLGVPVFSGWPQWNSTSHQQAYYLWLQRAWQGGLRLMTMLGVTNEALCRGNKRLTNYPDGYPAGLGMESEGTGCFNSMTSIDQQLQAANDFQTFVDDQSGGAGKG